MKFLNFEIFSKNIFRKNHAAKFQSKNAQNSELNNSQNQEFLGLEIETFNNQNSKLSKHSLITKNVFLKSVNFEGSIRTKNEIDSSQDKTWKDQKHLLRELEIKENEISELRQKIIELNSQKQDQDFVFLINELNLKIQNSEINHKKEVKALRGEIDLLEKQHQGVVSGLLEQKMKLVGEVVAQQDKIARLRMRLRGERAKVELYEKEITKHNSKGKQ